MTILYLPDEKVPLRIDDITVYIQQLTMAQKATIIEKLSNTDSALSLIEAARLAVKYGVKGLEGVTLSSGKAYSLEFDGHVLTDSCVDALLCLPQSDKLQGAWRSRCCWRWRWACRRHLPAVRCLLHDAKLLGPALAQ